MPIEVQTNLALEAHPVDPAHVVNIEWVVNYVAGKIKAPVRVVATANQAGSYNSGQKQFTYTATGATVIDGETLALNDRVLLAGQTTATQNGIYTVHTVGAGATHTILERASDFNNSSQIFSGVTIGVNQGDDHAHSFWKLTSDDPITLDTTALNFINVRPPAGGVVKFSEEIHGDGTQTHFDIDHSLGSEDVSVQIWNNATNGMVLADVTVVDDDTIEVGFDVAPTAAQVYRVVVLG